MPDFLLPDLGEGLTEAEIITWHVRVGDTVSIDQAVVEVETAKAAVEVPVPFAGRVVTLHGQPGDVLTVGSPLVTVEEVPIEQPFTEQSFTGRSFIEPGVVTADPQPDAATASGNVLVGYGTSDSPGRRRRRSSRGHQPAGTEVQVAANGSTAVVSPLVRRLAHEAHVDIATIRGSGGNGLITRQDVDQAIQAAPRTPAPGADQPRTVEPRTVDAGGVTRIPIRGLHKAMATKMSRSRHEIPEATVWVDVDATDLVELRASLNRDQSQPSISLLALIGRFAVLGLQRFPELNARIDGDEIVLGQAIHLGFAAQTDRGLVVPVVADAHAQSVEQLSTSLARLTEGARAGSLGVNELTGGTFTVNNYGVFGVDGSAAIINHPEVAILGIGRIIDRPWAVAGQLQVRRVAQLTLAFDHRVCDGGTAGGFLRFVADCVESPGRAVRYL